MMLGYLLNNYHKGSPREIWGYFWRKIVMDKMTFEPKYFVDEIRENFYIPGMIKRSWAAQMDVLKVVADICDRHSIKWFANYGTLLGAVRHGGFIPWDDDLDIAMFRDDYVRFNLVVQDELPEGYRVLNFDTEMEYELFLTRVVNSSTIDVSNDYLLKNHGFPYIAGIDIFPLDYIFEDEEAESERKNRCRYVWELVSRLESYKKDDFEIANEVKLATGYNVDSKLPLKAALLRVIDKIFQECPFSEAKEVTLMPIWIEYDAQRCPIYLYDDLIEMPFENGTITVPAGYDEILRHEYGNWELVNKSGGIHEYPYYKEQEKQLISEKKRAPYRYIFNSINLDDSSRKDNKIKNNKIYEQILLLKEASSFLINSIKNTSLEDLFDLLNGIQQLAINIGNAIENSYYNHNDVINCLEQLCERVYEISVICAQDSGNLDQNTIDSVRYLCMKIEKDYNMLFKKQDGIYFMPVKAEDWKFMDYYYQKKCKEGAKVYVMPVPYADRMDDGKPTEFRCDYDLFPNSLPLIYYSQVNLDALFAAEIVIQNPWDEYGSGMVVFPSFFSSALKNKTDKLTYIPPFENLVLDEYREIANAEYYSVCPATINADTVILESERAKEVYIKWLIEKTSVYDSVWDSKIIIDTLEVDHKESTLLDKKVIEKKMIFFASFSDLYIHNQMAIDWIKRTMDCIKNSNISVVWLQDNNMIELLEDTRPELLVEYESILDDFRKDKGEIAEYKDIFTIVREINAFYGSGGSILNMCINRNIPSMLRKI